MTQRLASLYASFAADALSLGTHWIYNQAKIARLYPDRVLSFDDPHSEYHPTRRAGQFTHYGDQSLALLRSLALRRGWSEDAWREDWRALWEDYDGYRDTATTETLANLQSGSASPSTSNDLAGASRLAPLLVALADAPLDEKIAAARAQTALTHGDPTVIDAAEFFVRATELILDGASVVDALNQSAAVPYPDLPAREWLALAQDAARHEDHLAATAKLGLTCHNPEAFPATLHHALRFADDFTAALTANTLAGGDNSSRAMPLAMMLGAAHGFEAIPWHWIEPLAAHREIEALLTLLPHQGAPSTTKTSFPSSEGHTLDARLELPAGPIRAVALFAHCFTCGKDLRAAVTIARTLAAEGIATLRFDFTGLGTSEGEFAATSFVTNIEDLLAAADFLRDEYLPPALLIGHSLGGAAVLAAAGRIPEALGVATIGAPADPNHITHLLGDDLAHLETNQTASITIAGRPFKIGKRFLDDLAAHCQPCEIATLQRDLLILHAPTDEIVGIDNARQIYEAAKHPKSFLSLTGADHLLTPPGSADYAARIIAAWASRLV